MRLPAWQLQEAKNDFSRLIKLASNGAAQTVTDHGEPAADIVSAAGREKLTRPTAGTLSKLLLKPGLAGDAFATVRENDLGRDLKL